MKSKQYFYNVVLGTLCLGVLLAPSVGVQAQIQNTEATQISESGAGSGAGSTNASLEAQIAALLAQVAALQNQLSGTSTVPPANPDPRPTNPSPSSSEPENEQLKARLAIREANTLNRELRSLVLGMDDRTAATEPRAAYREALKLVSSARRDYISKRYPEAYSQALDAQAVARRGIAFFNQLPAPVQCPMTGVICANGAAPTVDAKGCYTICPVAPVMCPMDAQICPDGSTVGRVPPSCQFALCPTRPGGGGGGGGGGPTYNLQ